MSSSPNFERSDERFVEQVRTAQNREQSIALLSSTRSLMFYIACCVSLLSLVVFVASCIIGKPDFFDVMFSPMISIFIFFIVDSQIKVLKLAHQEERVNAG